MKTVSILLAAYLAVVCPTVAFGATWVLPSGTVVNDAGVLISGPTWTVEKPAQVVSTSTKSIATTTTSLTVKPVVSVKEKICLWKSPLTWRCLLWK